MRRDRLFRALVPLWAAGCLAAVDVAAQLPAPPLPPVRDPNDKSRPLTPAGNPGLWATNDDYPAAAMREEREGTSGFRLTIDANGLPIACDIVSSSGHADLDSTTCALLLERARFRPGLDAAGKRVGGTYTNRIRWQIPDGTDAKPAFMPTDFAQMLPRIAVPDVSMFGLDPADHYPAAARLARREGVVDMLLDVAVDGKVTGCAVQDSSGHADLDSAACALMREKGKFKPALDGAGQASAGRYAASFTWSLPEAEPTVDENALTEALGDLPRRTRTFPMGKPGSATLSILINADGSIGDCRFDGEGAMDLGSMAPCDMFGGKNVYAPLLDDKGNPVARRVTLRTDLTIEDAPAAATPAK
ncbi:energy transducer TonB [Sphingopyxis sp. KK2]|uniref:energy transducer TonB n=1 Tax=Sphingopyxis sp. KK2 TaxID=1855727 RepID=UPI0009F8F41E|nr:energy transducer TonB [Sphingopyxis sp. KK2]